MEDASPQTPEKHRQRTHTQKLHSQFSKLERHWDSLKHSNPAGARTRTRMLSRTGTRSTVGTHNDGDTAAGILFNSPQPLNARPKNLTLSLLQETSSLESESKSETVISAGASTWKVWNNELALEDIHKQRRVAKDAVNLMGRCLREALEGAADDRSTALDGVPGDRSFINCSDGPAVDDSSERDNAFDMNASSSRRCSFSSSSPWSDPKNTRMKRQEGLAIVGAHAKNDGATSGRSRRLWKFVLVMTGIALMGVALLGTRSFLQGDETVITVPT